MKTLEKLLIQLGFDELQGKIYSELYFNGPSSILEISRLTLIKRPTVHFHIEQLIERGLVSETVIGGKRKVVAEDPDTFVELVEKKKEKLIQTEATLGRVLEEVTSLTSHESMRGISVLVDEGFAAVKQVYKEAFEYGDVYSYFNVDKGNEIKEIRSRFFDSIVARKLLSSYEELYYSSLSAQPDYVKKMKSFSAFSFSRTGVRLYGNAVAILVFGQNLVLITCEKDWRLMRVTQPVLAMFVREMIDSHVL